VPPVSPSLLSAHGVVSFGTAGTVDQRSAGGPDACSVLAVRVAAWLTARAGEVPAGGDLDNLMHEGAAAWKALCGHEGNRARFHDLHFDLETALAAQTAVRVDPNSTQERREREREREREPSAAAPN
jgi:hypothetical protein